MIMEAPVCQSCGMPMTEPAHFGTEKDGSQSGDYCVYCYKDGTFTADVTMEEMMEMNLKYLDEFNKDSPVKFTEEEARKVLPQYLMTLKRWKK